MTDRSKPKFEDIVIMTVYPGQRRKAGTSRIAIKKEMIEKYGATDDKRTATRIRDTIKKLVEEKIFDPITAHSFHLTPEGLEKAKEIKASMAWRTYTAILEGKEVPKVQKPKATSSTASAEKGKKKATTTKRKTTAASAGTAAKAGQGTKKATTRGATKKTVASPKSSPKAAPKRAPRQKRVHYDAVTAPSPEVSSRSKNDREERAKRMAERHNETHKRYVDNKTKAAGTTKAATSRAGKRTAK